MRQLYIPSKMSYVKGKRPSVQCILCSVCSRDRRVTKLEVHRTRHWVVSANLHPYTAGHMMAFPFRHIADVRQLRPTELVELHQLQKLCLDVLDAAYAPAGYNVGFNIGRPAGASIEHLHLHIVPRYPNEAGFLDILSDTRSIVEDPKQTVRTLKRYFKKLSVRPPRGH